MPSWKYSDAMTKTPYPSDTQDRFIVRFPEGMRDQIATIAKANGRSMNAEIVARLEKSLRDEVTDKVMGAVMTPAWLDKFMERVNELAEQHGVEYLFPEEDHQGKKRRIKPKDKK